MIADVSTSFEIEASEGLFRLVTEGIRLTSNEHHKIEQIEGLMDASLKEWRSHRVPVRREVLEEHLRLIPVNGDIKLHIRIVESSLPRFDEVSRQINRIVGHNASIATCVSALMLNYIANRETERLIDRLGISGSQMNKMREILHRARENVHPIR